jgi:hypothetical protein
MSPRTLDELATDIDDALRIVEELQDAPDVDTDTRLGDLKETLERAQTTIDELENATR